MEKENIISLKEFGYADDSSYSIRKMAVKLAVKYFSVSEIIDHMFKLGQHQEHVLDDCQEFLGEQFTVEQIKKFGVLKREFGFKDAINKKTARNIVYSKQKIYGYGLNLDPEFIMI